MNFCNLKKIKPVNKVAFLVYFNEQSKMYKPSLLWSSYWMIRTNLTAKENIDISHFKQLYAFLKRQNDAYHPKKSKVLTKEHITEFLVKAPDEIFSMTAGGNNYGYFWSLSQSGVNPVYSG